MSGWQVVEDMECSHYMKNYDIGFVPLRTKKEKELLLHIEQKFSTLAWCRRWLEGMHKIKALQLRDCVLLCRAVEVGMGWARHH